MGWSEQQLLAIETRNKNVLVAAAAGSGKTSVLVERIISRILDTDQPVDVDKVLVVTFTNAAAAEMRGRIGAALNEALKKQPRSEHIQRQLALLNSSAISTIHAFCQSLVRQYFHLLELDPQFRIAGQAEVTIMKTEVLEQLFEQRYAQGDEEFLTLVEHYGDEQSDASLYQLVLGLYEFSRSHPFPEQWLEGLPQSFLLPEDLTIEQTPWSKLIRDKIVLELEQAGRQLELLCREAAGLPGVEAYTDTFIADRALLDEILSAAVHSWEKLASVIAGSKFAKLAAVPKGTDEGLKKYFQRGRQKVKDKVSTCKALFFDRSPEALLEDLRAVAPVMKTLSGLIIEFGKEFAKAKRGKNIVDFNDLEHFCLEILLAPESKPGAILPSAVAMQLQERFKEVMVDEYQDTNGVQETILGLVANAERPNLFLVGDVKQSIYRFRLAEPELFMEKYRQYPLAGKRYLRIDLSQNFRSRASILHAVNFLFVQLMTPGVGEMEYKDAEKLNPGPDYPEEPGNLLEGPAELCLIDREEIDDHFLFPEGEMDGSGETDAADLPAIDLMEEAERSGFELEASLIARKISEFMTGNYRVYDKESKRYRSLAWRDMVILLRSVKGKAGVMLDILRKAGIPAYAELDAGYFKEVEVQIMISLLSVIDNPRQDIALAAVLRSPLAGFRAKELAEIRVSCLDGDLWSALTKAAEGTALTAGARDKAAVFVGQLERWRDLSRRKGVPELIWQIYRDTGYYDYAGGMPGGMLRQANLRALHDRARQYEATNFRGLFRFLRFVERMQDKGSDLAVARALGESEDVVRIMSIHKSKGLEFPLVFVADLGKNMNMQDSKALIVSHKLLGIGPYVTDPELRFRYPTLARHGISHKLMMETKAEELRILYVALTRAREKLILVGSANKLAQKAAGWCQYTDDMNPSLPDALIAGAGSYLDWLCPAVARHRDGGVLRSYGECSLAPCRFFAGDASSWKVEIVARRQLAETCEDVPETASLLNQVRNLQPVEGGEDFAGVAKILGWRYGFQNAVGKPAKLSVTEIKRRFDAQWEHDGQPMLPTKSIALRPRFIQQSAGLTGAERGTLMHSVMQHINLRGDLSEEGIRAQIAGMVDREMILPEHAGVVDIGSIAAFFASSLGSRLCASPRVRREIPFSLLVPAGKFYEDMMESGESIFIQGVIDALFDEGDNLVLVDYKTDWVTDSSALIDRYAVQLFLYAEAVGKIFGKSVVEKFLYVFSTREAVSL